MINRIEIIEAVNNKQDVRLSTGETMNPWAYSTLSSASNHYGWWIADVREALQEWKTMIRGLNPDVRRVQIMQSKINNTYNAIHEYRLAMCTRFELRGLGMFAK